MMMMMMTIKYFVINNNIQLKNFVINSDLK